MWATRRRRPGAQSKSNGSLFIETPTKFKRIVFLMTVYSMTGYASTQSGSSNAPANPDTKVPACLQLGLEIRSVNSRFLDLGFRLPDDLRAHEPALRDLLTARLKRGKVEVRVSLELQQSASIADPRSSCFNAWEPCKTMSRLGYRRHAH